MGELQQPMNQDDPPIRRTMIANNSKSFANGSKSLIRNNLGLYKHSDIYLIWNICMDHWNISMDLIV